MVEEIYVENFRIFYVAVEEDVETFRSILVLGVYAPLPCPRGLRFQVRPKLLYLPPRYSAYMGTHACEEFRSHAHGSA